MKVIIGYTWVMVTLRSDSGCIEVIIGYTWVMVAWRLDSGCIEVIWRL
jgi:hypothetical protein